jgi:hypothetical protein
MLEQGSDPAQESAQQHLFLTMKVGKILQTSQNDEIQSWLLISRAIKK